MNTTPKYETRSDILVRLADEMSPFIVGPLPATTFLNLFLPPAPLPSSDVPPFVEGMFDPLFELHDQPEVNWYEEFIKIVSPRVKNLEIFKTTHTKDETPYDKFAYKVQPDCAVYMKGKGTTKLKSSCVDFVIEFKSELYQDPFIDDSSENSGGEPNAFVRSDGNGRHTLGQLTAYATSILGAQYRTHAFMVLIVRDYARLIRWDRSGAVVTKRISFNAEPHLLDFLICYNFADEDACGHDCTVGIPPEDEVILAKAIVPELKDHTSFLAVTISDRRFIIHAPEFKSDVPVGRWTRATFAYNVKDRCRVLLKDSWRISEEDIEPEGEIYRRLYEGNVPNIPLLLLDGDVGDDDYHRSQTQEVQGKYFPDHSHWRLTPHRHYRIVLRTIGKRLEKFSCTREFVSAMYAALEAHKAAYNIGILHRDISPGNILIFGNNESDKYDEPHKLVIRDGMLIDWDLSKILKPDVERSTPHQHSQIGTWKFMAADLIENSRIPQTFAHDLESFFWVLIWMVMTHVQTSWGDTLRSSFVHETMSGGSAKMNFLTSSISLYGFSIPGNLILSNLVKGLKVTVADRHLGPPPTRINPLSPFVLSRKESTEPGNCRNSQASTSPFPAHQLSQGFMDSHDMMLSQFTRALAAEWPSNDEARPQQILWPNSVYAAKSSGTY